MSLQIKELIISILLTIVTLYFVYSLFQNSTFGAVFLFNIALDVVSMIINGGSLRIISIIAAILPALIITAIENALYKRSTSFKDFVIKYIVLCIIIFVAIFVISFLLTYVLIKTL